MQNQLIRYFILGINGFYVTRVRKAEIYYNVTTVCVLDQGFAKPTGVA
jgi:hypothetical protein